MKLTHRFLGGRKRTFAWEVCIVVLADYICLSSAGFCMGKVKLKRTVKASLKGKRGLRARHNFLLMCKEIVFGRNSEDLITDCVL